MKQTSISIVVAALLAGGLLAGCGGGSASSDSTKLLAQTGCAGSSCYGYNTPSSTSLQFYVNSAPWADLHYTINGGAQLNIRMTVSGANNTYTVSGLKTGDVVKYFFTVGNTAGGATDTAWLQATVGSATPTPAPTPTPTPTPTPAGNVTLYNDCNYGGWAASFGVGSYKLADMVAHGAVNDQASSIRIPAGYQVTLYKDDNFTNTAVTLTGDNSCFTGINFNDLASSMVVSTAGSPTPAPTPTPTPAPTPTPTGPWNGNTTFTLVNNTHAAYADSQVYWAIIGKDWNTGQFVWVNASGQLIPMSTADNGALTKGGQTYTNYFHTLAQAKSVTIPPINSARMMLSVGTPMYIKTLVDGAGNIGYAGANIENPSDPNIDVYFDFIEMAILPTSTGNPGIFANTTRVDQFGFPVLMRVQGSGFDQTVGETETRSALISEYLAAVPSQFQGLAQAPYAPYRIVAPAHGTFGSGGANGTYLDSYINALWTKYASQNLVFTDQQGTFTGHVSGSQFQFSDGQGTYIINKPTTPMALLGNGTLNDPTGQTPGTAGYDKQLQNQAQMCAAINRHIVEDPAHWYTQSSHYLSAPANYYAKFWHDHGVNGLAYGFAYDDVGGFSPSLHTAAPTTVTVTVGW